MDSLEKKVSDNAIDIFAIFLDKKIKEGKFTYTQASEFMKDFIPQVRRAVRRFKDPYDKFDANKYRYMELAQAAFTEGDFRQIAEQLKHGVPEELKIPHGRLLGEINYKGRGKVHESQNFINDPIVNKNNSGYKLKFLKLKK